mmetsp:Transcript_3712/g.6778  ORF Transcript_3712/g.6778 Transcript_3712/m.6778 type:complete len:288 (+) Transcript_3712:246-1109(+)
MLSSPGNTTFIARIEFRRHCSYLLGRLCRRIARRNKDGRTGRSQIHDHVTYFATQLYCIGRIVPTVVSASTNDQRRLEGNPPPHPPPILSQKSQNDIVPRSVANEHGPSALRLTLHRPQKRRQVRRDHAHPNTPSLNIRPHVIMTIPMFAPREEDGAEGAFDVGQCGTAEVGTVGNDAENGRGGFAVGTGPHLLNCFCEVGTCLIEFVGLDFVDDDAGDVHSILQKKRTIQLQFVKRLPQPSIRDQHHIGPQLCRHPGIACTHNSTYTGVPRAFANGNGRRASRSVL